MERKRGKKNENEMAGCFGLVSFHRFAGAGLFSLAEVKEDDKDNCSSVNFDGLFHFTFSRIVQSSVLHRPRLSKLYLFGAYYQWTDYCSLFLSLLFLSLLSLSSLSIYSSSSQINKVRHRQLKTDGFLFFKKIGKIKVSY